MHRLDCPYRGCGLLKVGCLMILTNGNSRLQVIALTGESIISSLTPVHPHVAGATLTTHIRVIPRGPFSPPSLFPPDHSSASIYAKKATNRHLHKRSSRPGIAVGIGTRSCQHSATHRRPEQRIADLSRYGPHIADPAKSLHFPPSSSVHNHHLDTFFYSRTTACHTDSRPQPGITSRTSAYSSTTPDSAKRSKEGRAGHLIA